MAPIAEFHSNLHQGPFMISLILCSRTGILAQDVLENITQTIGIPFELIVIDNSTSRYSIFSAYNEGIRRSKFPYLCFIHEDILFRTLNWGELLVRHLQKEKAGILGIAGSHFTLPTIAGWGFNPSQSMHYLQRMNPNEPAELFSVKYIATDSDSSSATCIDGVFLAMTRELSLNIRFDDVTFQGFHCYDQDICMQAFILGYDNRVIFDIMIEHFSKGSFNNQWIDTAHIWLNKWRDQLPASTIKVSPEIEFDAFWTNTCWYIYILLKNRNFKKELFLEALSYSLKPRLFPFFARIQPWRVLLWFVFKCRV